MGRGPISSVRLAVLVAASCIAVAGCAPPPPPPIQVDPREVACIQSGGSWMPMGGGHGYCRRPISPVRPSDFPPPQPNYTPPPAYTPPPRPTPPPVDTRRFDCVMAGGTWNGTSCWRN